MTTAMTTTNGNGQHTLAKADDISIIERVIAMGDLSKLTSEERVHYYVATCRSVGLNPMTKPFEYITLNGKLSLYSTKNCTDQLRQIHGISVNSLKREERDGLVIVYAHMQTAGGRHDQDIGAVNVQGLKGEALANAFMKATTKAKRRTTLSICGLSMLDESELDTVPTAKRVKVNHDTGDVLESSPDVTAAPVAADPKDEEYKRLSSALARCDSERALDEAWPVIKDAAKKGAITKSHLNALTKQGAQIRAALEAAPAEEALAVPGDHE